MAIAAAARAFGPWSGKAAGERATLLERWHDLVLESSDDLALLMTLEQGKPLAESRAEISYGASFIKWFAEEARRVHGETIPSPSANGRILVQKQPVGVVAAITPWNFPNAMITRKAAPALAAGCSVVIKPSELTPFSALVLGVLAERAGIPAGVINIVTGDAAAIGAALTESPTVRKLTFTGSTRVGKLLMAQSASTVKRLGLELGGNARPFSSSMTPISRWPSPGSWSASFATAVRPASLQIGFWCSRVSTTLSQAASLRRSRRSGLVMDWPTEQTSVR
jgi:succinate-semialdehyde dehydrogenase / glutarate-semialdehyde dehydrogenase